MANVDRELEAHKEWLGYLQPVGVVVSPPALIDAQAYVNRNIIEQQQALQALCDEDDDDNIVLTDFPAFTRDVLGWYDDDLQSAPPEVEVALPDYEDLIRADWAIADPDTEAGYSLLVKKLPMGATFDDPVPGSRDGWHASPQVRMERLLRETRVPAALLFNGTDLRLTYAPRGETSGHITFPFSFMVQVPGRLVFGAMLMLLEAERIFEGPLLPEQRLTAILENSRKYQAQVSTDLAEQVLDALWELLRGFQAADEAINGRLLGTTPREHPEHVYGGLITVLMRLVFVLYAEDRGLMPEDEVYQQNYAVGALFERLREDAGLHPDTMDQRYGAWAWLISLFRLVYDGGHHRGLRLPPRHGQLFDPNEYPFLEGRPYGSVRQTVDEVLEPPRVADGVVYRVLNKLLILHGERLSYRALDVEQIGSVYEAIMGFHIERAFGPSIALRPTGGGSKLKGHVVVDLQEVLELPPKKRRKHLQNEANCKITGKSFTALKAAETVDDLVGAVSKRISPRTPSVLPPNSLYLQPGEERRRTGSHYTPRELTEPIVRTTLRPILDDLGDKPTPEQILDLKVCDPAMGSGAFLVEACRQLADELVDAWNHHDSMPDIPPDEEPVLHARRLVAQRCLYGVDKNPFAVDLAKLSLWLITLARDHAFTFVDHALKHGDSLVGLSRKQIAMFTWEDPGDLPPILAHIAEGVGKAKSERDAIHALGDGHEQEKHDRWREAEYALNEARLTGDLVIAAFFAAKKAKARRKKLAEYRALLDEGPQAARGLVDDLREGDRGVPPLHWEIEFPEVFDRRRPGFDAFVGNPPFMGGSSISSTFGRAYLDWVKAIHPGTHGNGDFVAHFYRRGFDHLRISGTLGLIATNTIAQGDTRATGLAWICTHGGTIYAATRRVKWPGLAAVVVSVVHVIRGSWSGPRRLDGSKVPRITAFLFHSGSHENPRKLQENAAMSFLGSKVYGQGFTFDDNDRKGVATPIAEMHRLIEKDPRNAERVFPYIGGAEVNSSPTHSHHRYVINFGDMSEEEARQWPDLMAIVEEKVKPDRMTNKRAVRKKYWWRFGETTPALFRSIDGLERVLVTTLHSHHLSIRTWPLPAVFSHGLAVFSIHGDAAFCALQSRIHEVWARFFGSSLGDALRYTPSDCFETFPFPPDWTTDPALEAAGQAYYDFRDDLMVDNDEGLTTTYNRFQDPNERDPGILRLRELHDAMDRAVLDAYAWHDIPTDCEFLLDYPIDEENWNPRKKKPYRYRWPDEVHDEVLARLLDLNQKSAEEEKLKGAEQAKPKRKKKPAKPRRARAKSNAQAKQVGSATPPPLPLFTRKSDGGDE